MSINLKGSFRTTSCEIAMFLILWCNSWTQAAFTIFIFMHNFWEENLIIFCWPYSNFSVCCCSYNTFAICSNSTGFYTFSSFCCSEISRWFRSINCYYENSLITTCCAYLIINNFRKCMNRSLNINFLLFLIAFEKV